MKRALRSIVIAALLITILSTNIASAASVEEDSEITEFKESVLSLINEEREAEGIKALKNSESVSVLADIRAAESVETFGHTRPDGTRGLKILTEYSMPYRAAGENLAKEYNTPESVVDAWLESETHHDVMLDPDYKYVGIGYYKDKDGMIYCAALFYTPK